jgi:hypothetical protein
LSGFKNRTTNVQKFQIVNLNNLSKTLNNLKMTKTVQLKFIALLLTIFSFQGFAQDYSTADFVGTWHGTISSTNYGGYNEPITMTIYEDGFYVETNGRLMPSLYPNTQQFEYDAATNRLHWWYLDLVYAGQLFYAHFFYELVYFENDVLEVHYNFWDDPEPNPDAGTIYLVREGSNALLPPVNLIPLFDEGQAFLSWDAPDGSGNPELELEGYNVFGSFNMSGFELLGNTVETSFFLGDSLFAGMHAYYVSAVYDEGESDPSDEVFVFFTTPEPEALAGASEAQNISLSWDVPNNEFGAVATFLGFNVYHKYDGEEYELVAFTEAASYVHENLPEGTHNYYVTAVYLGGESSASNEIEINMITTRVNERLANTTKIFPNPASTFVSVSAQNTMLSVKVMNQAGQLVMSSNANSINTKLDVGNLPAGLYMMVIETNEGLISKKMMVE